MTGPIDRLEDRQDVDQVEQLEDLEDLEDPDLWESEQLARDLERGRRAWECALD